MSEPEAPPHVLKAPEGKLVLAAIHRVMEDMAKEGVGKNKTNQSQNFQYRGVDDVMDALAPSLSRNRLVILPSVIEHNIVERESRNGGKIFHATLKLTYEFMCPIDGSSKIVGPIYGEAMDTGDKATNKAMAIAYKYLCVQAFCIPITGDDPDQQSHEIAKGPAQAPANRTRPADEKGSSSSVKAHSPVPAPANGKPAHERPGGAFSYGKKYFDVPWNVMKTDDLTWFLNADRTPQHVREKIVLELEWREYETRQLEAVIAAERPVELSDEIP